MEGGITVKSPSMLRLRRYPCLILLLIIVSALMLVSLSYSQSGKTSTSEMTYKMIGRLQLFSLDDKRAQIDDLVWNLADNFRKKEIPSAWTKGTVEFSEREVWVYYYVSSLTVAEASHRQRGINKNAMELITNPDEIRKIREMGGKIYKIELRPE
jgi:hypothetical protein